MLTNDRGLTHYLTLVGSFKQLTAEEERTSDRDALITANLRLAVHIARQYAYNVEDLLDYIQEANIGLMQAAETFDPSRAKFSTWATMYIKGAIRNERRDPLGKRIRQRPTDALPSTCDVDSLAEQPAPDCPELTASRHQALEQADRLLTANEAKVLGLRLQGWTFEEIAAERGATWQAAQRLQLTAMRAIGHVS